MKSMDEKKNSPLLFPDIEERVLAFWRENNIFEKSVERRKDKKHFVFFEGPPYANGKPGIHHVLARAFKDVVARYKTMRGYYVPRQAGWDTHGLPTEMAAEKALGVKSKREIEENIGIEAFVKAARENVFLYKAEWEKMTERMGYWLDMAHPYVTMDNPYIESLWAIIKKIYERGLLYQADKVLPWCLRCGTALSSHELAQGYKKITENAITVKFVLSGPTAKWRTDRSDLYFLAWTTTPWTLPGNVAFAVNQKAEYVILEVPSNPIAKRQSDCFLVAKNLAEKFFPDAKIIETKKGSELAGLSYKPLYEIAMSSDERARAYRVIAADFVSTEEGTGVVHIAPAFGEDDMRAGQDNNLPTLRTITEEGIFKDEASRWRGENIWNANEKIIEDLKARGLLLKEEQYEHDYPFCWRCDSKVIYFAKPSWWIQMSALRNQLIQENQTINWYPPYLKDGRFGEWISEVKDWAFSRERYWGAPLPVWQCDLPTGGCGAREVIGSINELHVRSITSRNRYILVRHGQAQSNTENFISDRLEHNGHDLTQKGIREAEHVAERIQKEFGFVDIIFSSPFLRAQKTADIIAQKLAIPSAALKIDPRFQEINTGIFSGKRPTEYHAYYQNILEKFQKAPPSGESLRDMRRRIYAAMREIEDRYQGKTILIVGHEYSLWMLWAVAMGVLDEEAVLEKEQRGDDFISTGGVEQISWLGIPRDEFGALDLHKPYIDTIMLSCGTCGALMRRVPEVIDVWFDSGAMPFASRHWPFAVENISYPADYICEAIDQTRGWFYTLLAVGVLMERAAPYKNVVSLGLALDEHGKKMSKSRGNIIDPWHLFETYGADAVRWYFFTVNQPWDEKRFSEGDVADVSRRFFMILWNCYQFFDTYHKTDSSQLPAYSCQLLINQWILARLDELIAGITRAMDSYDIVGAARDIEQFVVEDLSRWYIRRIRNVIKREPEDPARKETEETLRTVLLKAARLLAPFAPFIAEELYRELGGGEGSVHWEDWPTENQKSKIKNQKLLEDMKEARRVVSLALEARAQAWIKVRQPLSKLKIKDQKLKSADEQILNLIKEEINIKEICFDSAIDTEVALDTVLTDELRDEGLLRDVVREIQAQRKEEGLRPGELADVYVAAPADIARVVEKYRDTIARDTNTRMITATVGETLAANIKKSSR